MRAHINNNNDENQQTMSERHNSNTLAERKALMSGGNKAPNSGGNAVSPRFDELLMLQSVGPEIQNTNRSQTE